jgi:hypothetical protein
MKKPDTYFTVSIMTILLSIALNIYNPNHIVDEYISQRIMSLALKEGFTKKEFNKLMHSITTLILQKKDAFKKKMKFSEFLFNMIELLFESILSEITTPDKSHTAYIIAVIIPVIYYIVSTELLIVSDNIEELINTGNIKIFTFKHRLYTSIAIRSTIEIADKYGADKNHIIEVVSSLLSIITRINMNSSGEELVEHMLNRLIDVVINKTLNPSIEISVDRYDIIDYLSTDEGETDVEYVSDND